MKCFIAKCARLAGKSTDFVDKRMLPKPLCGCCRVLYYAALPEADNIAFEHSLWPQACHAPF